MDFREQRAPPIVKDMPEAIGQPTRVLRILLAEVSGLTAEFLRTAIAKQPDMSIVAEIHNAGQLGRALDIVGADVVITALSSPEVPATYHGLVFQTPSIAVVAIGADRRRVEVYTGTVIHEVALERLVTVMRDLCAHRLSRLASAAGEPSGG